MLHDEIEPPPAGTAYDVVVDETCTVLAGWEQMMVPPAFPIDVEAEAPLAESISATSAIADAMTPRCLS
jgi:hypothetical protein